MTARKTKAAKAAAATAAPETVLVLRTCKSDMSSHNGFRWPESGDVSAPDWRDTKSCGNGLHGWLWGQGNWGLKVDDKNPRWLVVEVEAATIVNLGDKVKFPRGNVIATFGHWRDAMVFIRSRRPLSSDAKISAEEGGIASATGDYGHASATGNSGHASATGYSGHASATGNSGHASATGNSGHASATGNSGHASATGDSGYASATGDYGHASATGNSGHASATGNSGHASATGNSGHASATGDYGHASATGDYGHASASGESAIAAGLGHACRGKVGKSGCLVLARWVDSERRFRISVAYEGEGIKADTLYRLDDAGTFVEVPE
jgi:hypothetical protein